MEHATSDEVTGRLVAILQRHLKFADDGPFPMETDLEEMGLDSITALGLLLEIEEAFGIQFPDSMFTQETFKSASTLGAAIRTLI